MLFITANKKSNSTQYFIFVSYALIRNQIQQTPMQLLETRHWHSYEMKNQKLIPGYSQWLTVDLRSFPSCLWLWTLSVPLNSLRLVVSRTASSSQQEHRRAACRRWSCRPAEGRGRGCWPAGGDLATWARAAPSARRQQPALQQGGRPGHGMYRHAASPGRQVAARRWCHDGRPEAGAPTGRRTEEVRNGGEGRRGVPLESLESRSYGLFVGSIWRPVPLFFFRGAAASILGPCPPSSPTTQKDGDKRSPASAALGHFFFFLQCFLFSDTVIFFWEGFSDHFWVSEVRVVFVCLKIWNYVIFFFCWSCQLMMGHLFKAQTQY